MRFHVPLAAVALTATLAAQVNYSVSPAANATKVGTSSNTYPLYYQLGRYQQVHGDFKGTPRVMTAMSLRKGSYTSTSAGHARTLTCTLLACNAKFGPLSTAFGSNYDGTPITVMPKGTVSLPDWTFSQGSPEPWSVHFPFAAPFPYTGLKDFLWELLIHGNTNSTGYFADTAGDYALASSTVLGTGCIAGGQTLTHRLYGYLSTATHDNSLRLVPSGAYGPATSPTALLAGTVNPDLTVPGLCEKLFVVPSWTFPGVTTSTGAFSPGAVAIVTHDPSWIGAILYLQLIAVDTSQTGLPFSMSYGRSVAIPAMNTYTPAPIYRVWNTSSDVATSGSIDTLFGGYGLIIRVTH